MKLKKELNLVELVRQVEVLYNLIQLLTQTTPLVFCLKSDTIVKVLSCNTFQTPSYSISCALLRETERECLNMKTRLMMCQKWPEC